MKLVTNPSDEHIEQIKTWLEAEGTDGFYCFLDMILDGFMNNQVYCLIEAGYAIGFVYWEGLDKVVKIEIAEIKKDKRDFGFGEKMIEECLSIFASNGCFVVDLECSPPESETFWEKLGFENYKITDHDPNQRMYKTLVPSLDLIIENDKKYTSVVELWRGEPYETEGSKSSWSWGIDSNSDTVNLTNPIIFPCHYEWRIRYGNDNEDWYNGKVKYMNNGGVYFDGFLIIETLRK